MSHPLCRVVSLPLLCQLSARAGRWQCESTRWSGWCDPSHRLTRRAIGGRSSRQSPTSPRSGAGVTGVRSRSPPTCAGTARSPRSRWPRRPGALSGGEEGVAASARPPGETPALGEALEKGEVSGEHVDAAGAALRNAEGSKRKQLAKRIDELAEVASRTSAEEFGRLVRAEAERLAGDGGEERLARQQRAIRFNHRVEPDLGDDRVLGQARPAPRHDVREPAEGTRERAVRGEDARRVPVRPGREARLLAGARAARPVRARRRACRAARGRRGGRHPRQRR